MNKSILKHNFTEPKDEPTIIGGGQYGTITGGRGNTISGGDYAFIGNGNNNTITSDNTVIVGGGYLGRDTYNTRGAFIGGGHNNTVGTTRTQREYRESMSISNIDTMGVELRDAHIEVIKNEMKRRILDRISEELNFEFWEHQNPAQFEGQLHCKVNI